MRVYEYDRAKAVAYAHEWAFKRNRRYYDFELLGGDCTNFASQCIYAGSGIMNFTPVLGWYYISASNRSPSWTGVEYLHNFLVSNRGVGPFAEVTDISRAEPGDVIQLSFDGEVFRHSPVVVSVGNPATPANILLAAHTYDADNRPLNTYIYRKARCLHILGVRK